MPQISDRTYRILIIWSTGSEKLNILLNLINYKSNTNKTYLYAKDPYEAKYQLLIKKREGVGPEKLNNYKAFVDYSDDNVTFIKLLINTIQIRSTEYL